MIQNLYPADELSQVRAQIRRLKLREDELRAGYLSGQLNPVGLDALVEIKMQRRRRFCHDRLPPDILNNPVYWDRSETPAVVVRPKPAQATSTRIRA
ncbi:hypothetical protein [Octadecabacter sp. R77987]|uniref:hypothetical protein n=1 Tax=Octadecabacter sp. R77987 TaxID=3093874 RepID=UPI00366EA772